jgi:hypothetical protein
LVTRSKRVQQDLSRYEVEIDLIEWDRGAEAVAAAFLKIMFDEVARSHMRYVRSGETDWSVIHSESARSKSTTMRSEFEVSTRQ